MIHEVTADDIPAIAETLPGFEMSSWVGVFAPAGTPAPVIAKLSAAVRRGLADADTRKRMEAAGYEVAAANSPEDFARFIQADTAKWLEVVQKAKISVK